MSREKIRNNEKNKIDEKTFGGRLTIAMGDISVYALGKKVGLSHTVLYKYRKNVSLPSIDKADEIAEALGVSFLWLAKGDGPMTLKEKEGSDPLVLESLKEVNIDLYTVVSVVEDIAKRRNEITPETLAREVALCCMSMLNK